MSQDVGRLKQEMQAIMERITEVESELDEYKYGVERSSVLRRLIVHKSQILHIYLEL